MGSIILLLLRYGAGINFKFTPKSSTFLDEETIAFGAVLPSNLQSSPITTIEEFTARIPHVDYLYYEGIIKRVLESPTQHSRPLLIEILTQIKALICQLSEKNELASLQATRLL